MYKTYIFVLVCVQISTVCFILNCSRMQAKNLTQGIWNAWTQRSGLPGGKTNRSRAPRSLFSSHRSSARRKVSRLKNENAFGQPKLSRSLNVDCHYVNSSGLYRHYFRFRSCTPQTCKCSHAHEPNRVLMKENKGFFSFAFDSAHVNYGVWTWPYLTYHADIEVRCSIEFDFSKRSIGYAGYGVCHHPRTKYDSRWLWRSRKQRTTHQISERYSRLV